MSLFIVDYNLDSIVYAVNWPNSAINRYFHNRLPLCWRLSDVTECELCVGQMSNIMACLDQAERLGIDVETVTANGKSLSSYTQNEFLDILELHTGLWCSCDSKTPFTRYNRLSNRLNNRLDNRLNVCLHNAASCSTGCSTGLTIGWTTGCIL